MYLILSLVATPQKTILQEPVAMYLVLSLEATHRKTFMQDLVSGNEFRNTSSSQSFGHNLNQASNQKTSFTKVVTFDILMD